MEYRQLKDMELEKITGGVIASQFINAITKAINSIYELGRETGSALRRMIKGKYCSVN